MTKKPRKSSRKRTRTVSLEIEIVIVGVDSNFDEATQPVFEYRRKHVYPKLKKHGFKLIQLDGNMATRKYVAQALREPNVEFFTGSGHGSDNRFTGSFLETVLEVGNYNPEEVKNKIIHLLACRAAFELGTDVVSNGCKAFFGYDTEFAYFPEHADAFLACDSEIDFASAEGKTARQAYNQAIGKFDQFISHFDQLDQLDQLGQDDVVATLQYNRDHLCSPDRDARWGNPQAKLIK